MRDVLLGSGLRADGGGPSGAVSLLGARIGGLDLLGGTVCSCSNPRLGWEIDGLTYTRIPRLALKRNREAWLELLGGGTPHVCDAAVPEARRRLPGRGARQRRPGDPDRAERRDQIARGGLRAARLGSYSV